MHARASESYWLCANFMAVIKDIVTLFEDKRATRCFAPIEVYVTALKVFDIEMDSDLKKLANRLLNFIWCLPLSFSDASCARVNPVAENNQNFVIQGSDCLFQGRKYVHNSALSNLFPFNCALSTNSWPNSKTKLFHERIRLLIVYQNCKSSKWVHCIIEVTVFLDI